MHIKQFRTVYVRVPDPLRPGKRAQEERLYPTGAVSLSHGGVAFDADEDGWFDVPAEVAEDMLKFRHPGGEKFYTPADVDEQVRLGALDETGGVAPVEIPPKPAAKTTKSAASKSED